MIKNQNTLFGLHGDHQVHVKFVAAGSLIDRYLWNYEIDLADQGKPQSNRVFSVTGSGLILKLLQKNW